MKTGKTPAEYRFDDSRNLFGEYIGKGIFFEIVMWSLPLIYIGLRLLLALPILSIILNRHRLK